MLVRIVKDWDWPDLMRQTPGSSGIWNSVRFTTEPVRECDLLLILNNRMKEGVTVKCPSDRIWVLMQEPYVRGHSDWMVEGLDYASLVLTHYPVAGRSTHRKSQPALAWHVNQTFDSLAEADVPPKTGQLSWVVGNAAEIPGHFKRLNLLRHIRESQELPIDLYGRAVRPVEDKWDALAPYRYSLAIENTSSPDYWTEKLADCFLSWTVPIYYGCPNLEAYFPKESFIRIEIDDPARAVERIGAVMRDDDWQRRLSALKEARDRVLHRYQLFPYISEILREMPGPVLPGTVVRTPGYKRSLKSSLFRAGFKLNREYRKIFS